MRDVSHIIAAYEYVIEQRKRYNYTRGAQGAFVVATNLSLGIDNVFCDAQPIWGGMYDLLGEVGILTGAGTANRSWNVDDVGDMPTTCTSDFLLTCLNTTAADQIYSGSAFGAVSIDVGAPGEGSYTTKVGNRYGSFSDNSAAAPHLTGAIALLYSLPCEALTVNALTQPAQTALSIRQAILDGVDILDNLKSKTATGGRLNVFRSMETLQNYCEVSTGDLALIKLYPNPTYEEITIEYEAPNFDDYELRVYNALGQLVHRNNITPPRFSEKVHSIDVHNWSPGMYFLTLGQGNDRVQIKFIVH
ncbi:MAG: S8 family peptidase [Saprospiraceae bacterium]|nr:S8 family peptidase [Saprospiraceae bacterium]